MHNSHVFSLFSGQPDLQVERAYAFQLYLRLSAASHANRGSCVRNHRHPINIFHTIFTHHMYMGSDKGGLEGKRPMASLKLMCSVQFSCIARS